MWNIAASGQLLLEISQSRGKSTGTILCVCVLFDVQCEECVLVRGSDSTISTWGIELP